MKATFSIYGMGKGGLVALVPAFHPERFSSWYVLSIRGRNQTEVHRVLAGLIRLA
jgi:hypothetical protein